MDSGRCFGAISSLLRNTGNSSSSMALCPGYRWQLCPLFLYVCLSLCVCVSSPTLACWGPCSPHPQLLGPVHGLSPCPVSLWVHLSSPGHARGPPWIFLSCFTFHFRIPCRADPSPERPSSPRAYRSVARISYTSQAIWGEREGLRDLPLGKLVGPSSPTHQPCGCGDTVTLPGHWLVCVAIMALKGGT